MSAIEYKSKRDLIQFVTVKPISLMDSRDRVMPAQDAHRPQNRKPRLLSARASEPSSIDRLSARASLTRRPLRVQITSPPDKQENWSKHRCFDGAAPVRHAPNSSEWKTVSAGRKRFGAVAHCNPQTPYFAAKTRSGLFGAVRGSVDCRTHTRSCVTDAVGSRRAAAQTHSRRHTPSSQLQRDLSVRCALHNSEMRLICHSPITLTIDRNARSIFPIDAGARPATRERKKAESHSE